MTNMIVVFIKLFYPTLIALCVVYGIKSVRPLYLVIVDEESRI